MGMFSDITFLKNGPNPASFLFIFGLFQTNNTIFTINQCEKCHLHPVSGAGIRTHELDALFSKEFTLLAGQSRISYSLAIYWFLSAKKKTTTMLLSFLKNGPTRPLFHLFSSFQTHITIFTTNKCENMFIQYPVLGFEPTTFWT